MHLYFRPSFDDDTRINFRFRLLVTWSSLHGLGASFHEIWCRYLYLIRSYWYFTKIKDGGRRHLGFVWVSHGTTHEASFVVRTSCKYFQTGYLPRPPTSPYRSKSLHAGWSLVCSSIFQVLLKSVQWFCRCGWSKIAFPHYFGHWLIKPW